MGKGGGGSSTTVQKADPWVGIQPALSTLYNEALNNYNSPGPQFFPNQTIADQSPLTLASQNLAAQRAMQGSSLNPAAQGLVGRTLNDQYFSNPVSQGLMRVTNGNGLFGSNLAQTAQGGFLNSNPYLDQTFNQAADVLGQQFKKNTLPSIASMFSGAGRYGSNAMQDVIGQNTDQYGRALSNLASNIYGGNYANERQLQEQAIRTGQTAQLAGLSQLNDLFGRERAFQMQAAGMAPNLAQTDYNDIGMLGQVGASQEQRQQALLNEQMRRFNFEQMQPQQKLSFLNSILNGGLSLSGSTSNTSQSGGNSPLMGALGGGMLGYSLLPALGASGALGSTAAASTLMGGAGINALGGMALGPLGLLGGAILGGLFH